MHRKYSSFKWVLLLVLLVAGVILIVIFSRQTPTENPDANSEDFVIDDYLYLLTYENFADREEVLDQVGQTQFDLVIIDTFYEGTSSWDSTEIHYLKNSTGGLKKVISYISIGEAEDFRYYWNDAWETTPPSWLDVENPDWPGCYKVRYWEEGWQSIIFDYIENYTLKAGFDGIFLDIVDGFEYYDEEVENAAELMVEFVCEIAEFSRSCANNTNFLIIPQNGEALHEYPEYLQCISGLAKEDIFYNDDTRNSPSEVNYVLNHVQAFQQAGKFVLLTEYCREAPHIADFYALASQHGFIPYSTTRDLDSIIINPGYEPD